LALSSGAVGEASVVAAAVAGATVGGTVSVVGGTDTVGAAAIVAGAVAFDTVMVNWLEPDDCPGVDWTLISIWDPFPEFPKAPSISEASCCAKESSAVLDPVLLKVRFLLRLAS